MPRTLPQLLPDPPSETSSAPQHGRLRILLVTVPFTFLLWLRLRREDPEAAAGLTLFAFVNIAQSVISLALIGLFAVVLVFREQIIYALAEWLVASGIVGP